MILVTLHRILVKVLNISLNKNSPKLWQSTFFPNKQSYNWLGLGVTIKRPLMCGVILLTLHSIIVKLLTLFLYLFSVFLVHFCRGSLCHRLIDG